MKIGTILKYRHNGKHNFVRLVILHDYKKEERFLYNIDYKVRIGTPHILYAKYTGERATKEDLKKYYMELKMPYSKESI